jgi:hypothetical protein
MIKNANPAPQAPEMNKTEEANPENEANRRPGRREWLRQVDFWENMKEFILRRIPPGSRPIDQLY